MSFNYYLRSKLKEKNITQAQLAKDLSTTKAVVNRWTKPYSKNPSKKSMKKVIEYFGDDFTEITSIFRAEECWGKFFWKNYRSLRLEKGLHNKDFIDIDQDALWRYEQGYCDYVELEDIKKIAKRSNCSIEKLVNCNNVIDKGGYNNIDLIGPEPSSQNQWGLDIRFYADFKIGTTEMEPVIHFGDQIRLKKDCITHKITVIPQKGDIVILQEDKNKFFIRKYEIINEQILYVASNPQFAPIPASEKLEIVGIVAQSITEF